MDADFWHERWATRQIRFHQADFNPLMVKYFGTLGLAPAAHVLVPLCGKTRDIAWLLSQGHRVTGAELSETAVQELFDELGAKPDVTQVGALTRYVADTVTVFAGDIFDLTANMLGLVDAVYDRAALVALPEGMRERYITHVVAISDTAPQFLLTYSYDSAEMSGPPFSITNAMVESYYSDTYQVRVCEAVATPAGALPVVAQETAWTLT